MEKPTKEMQIIEINTFPFKIALPNKMNIVLRKQDDINDQSTEAQRIEVTEFPIKIKLPSNEIFIINYPENNYDYSTEAILPVNEDKACLQALQMCLAANSNNETISKFLILIFLKGIGNDGKGVSYLDENKKPINVSTYFSILLSKIPDESNKFKNETARNEYQKRRRDINVYFENTKQLLIKYGWKERTPFTKTEIRNFEDIIKKCKYI
jgi:hypothetical protein